MKNDSASERIVPLVEAALDALQLAETAPYSPVNRFLTAKGRRELRRNARRLRERKVHPGRTSAHTAEELADVFERTVRPDEIHEQARRDFDRIVRDIDRVHEENRAEVEKALARLVVEARRSAEKAGPGSPAAERFRLLGLLSSLRWRDHHRERRQRHTGALPLWPGEPVIPIPRDDRDPARGRILFRVVVAEANWIGAFERGHTSFSAVDMMPGRKHLFVAADGAGYLIDWMTRTLVETIGTDIAGVMGDEANTLFFVDHGGTSLEGFGWNGRLWKTGPIGCGGFRRLAITDDGL
ncbi:MAG TPA: hypothetical protein VN605_03745, partial [Thermoanaerobaculia bacterium]|nr:hypothetical protein [Thermoanaerobaculia bacterium]